MICNKDKVEFIIKLTSNLDNLKLKMAETNKQQVFHSQSYKSRSFHWISILLLISWWLLLYISNCSIWSNSASSSTAIRTQQNIDN